jgi:hypothetical protein
MAVMLVPKKRLQGPEEVVATILKTAGAPLPTARTKNERITASSLTRLRDSAGTRQAVKEHA